MASSAISNLLAVFKTDASALPPAVLFIPTAYLFVQAEPLPDGMQASELEGFAGVTLEGLSPLPIDQLAWGYLAHEKSRHLLLFGAFQDRLRSENISPDDSYFHVLPSFFAAAPADGAAHWVFLWEAGHVAALHYLAGEVIPSRIELEHLKENTVTEAFAAREHLLKRLGAQARNEAAADGLLASPEGTRASRNRLNFSFLRYTAPEAESVKIDGHAPGGPAERWTADLRGGFFRAAEQKRRAATQVATRILQVAAAVAVLLLIVQVGIFAGRIWIGRKNSIIAGQKNDVGMVDKRMALLATISSFTDNQLHPYEMLGEINYYRPKEITFGKTRIYENNKMSVSDVTGTDVNAVDTFVKSLENSGLVNVDQGKLNFTVVGLNRGKIQLNLTFNKVPDAEPLPAPKPLPPPPPTPEELAAEADAGNAQDNTQGGPNGFQGAPNGFQGGPNGFQGQGGQFQGQGGQFQGQGPNPAAADAQPVDNTPAAPSGPTVYLNNQPPAPEPAPAPAAEAAPTPVAPAADAQPAQ